MTKLKSELNSVFLLKVVLFFILGTIWIRFSPDRSAGFGVPVGFILGLIFASHDHFRIDQKIEYTILFIAAVLSYILPIGAVILL